MKQWSVSNYYKKCVEEHERFYKNDKYIIRKVGWRFGTWNITTTDSNPPDFDWQPDDDPLHACVNMNDCTGSNIAEVEFVETWDGCWDDYEYDDAITDEEREEIDRVIEEDGFWELESHGWSPEDCDCYIWGPIQIDNEDGDTVAIVCSDSEGNTVAFKEVEEPEEETTFDELAKNNNDNFLDINPPMPPRHFPDSKELQGPAAVWPFPDSKDIK